MRRGILSALNEDKPTAHLITRVRLRTLFLEEVLRDDKLEKRINFLLICKGELKTKLKFLTTVVGITQYCDWHQKVIRQARPTCGAR